MQSVRSNNKLRAGRFLFWLLALIAALVILIFLWAAVPVWVTIAKGGSGRVWLFGNTGFVLAAAVAYLAVSIAVIAKRRTRGTNAVRT